MKRTLLGLAVLSIAALSLIGYQLLKDTPEQPIRASETVVEAPKSVERPTPSELLRLTNIERERAGVNPLEHNPLLDKSAQLKAEDMLANNYFDHVSPVTGMRGYEHIPDSELWCQTRGENLGRDYKSSADVVNAWMNSQTHKQVILDDRYEQVGFGVAGNYITQHSCDLL